ncbi:thioredoxin family protein [Hansschlegelia quercus]|uniref:thioredoxin family protein n=1 Tax=Hansschlegelia quercus TaxID=2528245 RepID=UPI0013EF4E37|nr:thioredoxin family protein [Hansschlegelia quercus]
MFKSRHAFAAALAAVALSVAPALSEPFSQPKFDAAMKAGAPIVVHVNATWCPTCMMQKPVLSKLLSEDRYGKFREFVVDYDQGKDTMRALKAPDRSTIIVFAKGKETGRGVGDVSEASVSSLLNTGL